MQIYIPLEFPLTAPMLFCYEISRDAHIPVALNLLEDAVHTDNIAHYSLLQVRMRSANLLTVRQSETKGNKWRVFGIWELSKMFQQNQQPNQLPVVKKD